MLIETLGAARDIGRINEIAGVLIRPQDAAASSD